MIKSRFLSKSEFEGMKHVGRYILKGWCLFRNYSRFSQVLSMAHIPTSVPWECEFHQDRDFCLLCRWFHFWYPRTVPHSLQSLSHVRLFVTRWTATHQSSLSITNWMANHFSILALRTPWTVWKNSARLVESSCNAGNLGSIPGLGRSPGKGKGYPLQYSGLENSMD